MGATVATGVDAPPVLESSEHVLDSVVLFVEDGVMGDGDFPVGLRRDAGGDFALSERMAEPVGVVAPVGEEFLGLGKAGSISAAPLKSLIWPSLSNMTSGRPSLSQTACSLEFGPPLVRPISRGTDPFKRLAAVRFAFRCVASIMIRSPCRPCGPVRRKSC